MPPGGLVDLLVRGFSIALDGKYQADLCRFQSQARIHVVRPQLAREIGLLDFRHGAELIETAYRQTLWHFTQAGLEKGIPSDDIPPGAFR